MRTLDVRRDPEYRLGAASTSGKGRALLRGARDRSGGLPNWIGNLNKSRGVKARHVHAHLLRHSCAVHLLRGGADIRYIQRFLGHESIDSARIYLRLVPADLRKAYEAAMPEVALST